MKGEARGVRLAVAGDERRSFDLSLFTMLQFCPRFSMQSWSLRAETRKHVDSEHVVGSGTSS